MKILTWNIERLTTTSKRDAILAEINKHDADIIILTETHKDIFPDGNYQSVSTLPLTRGSDNIDYKSGESRVNIFSKFPIVNDIPSYDAHTSVCIDVNYPTGIIRVYGTIIGVFGGKGERFKSDLTSTLKDFKDLLSRRKCIIAGDFNVFLSGYAYPSKTAREQLLSYFSQNNLTCITSQIDENVDHIVISKNLISNTKISTWNHDKKLSDHIGICVEL